MNLNFLCPLVVEVEYSFTYAKINLALTGVEKHVVAYFFAADWSKSFRKKATKFAKRLAKKEGGLQVKKIDHTKGKSHV